MEGSAGPAEEWTVLLLKGKQAGTPSPHPRDGDCCWAKGTPWTDKGETAFRPRELGAHRGMLPVQDDLRDVFHGVQKVVVSPLVPVDGHRAVFVHAARGTHGCPCVNTPRPLAALPASRGARGRPVAAAEERQGGWLRTSPAKTAHGGTRRPARAPFSSGTAVREGGGHRGDADTY